MPIEPERQRALGRFIRKSFRRNRDVERVDLLSQGFRAGYEVCFRLPKCLALIVKGKSLADDNGRQALDLLRASASGDAAGTERILGLLGTLVPVKPRRSKDVASSRAPVGAPKGPSKPERDKPMPVLHRTSILDRPYLKVSGRRHVPRLCSANSIPFLRIKKPQPLALAMMLCRRIKRRARWFTMLERLEHEMARADLEDRWDVLVQAIADEGKPRRETGPAETTISPVTTTESSWGQTCQFSINLINNRKYLDTDVNMRMARRMTEIIWKEQELADKEDIERKKNRNRERWRRRRERWRREKVETRRREFPELKPLEGAPASASSSGA